MSGKAGEIVVGGVLGNVLPGSLAKLFDGNGSGSDGSGQLLDFVRCEKSWASCGSCHSLHCDTRLCRRRVCRRRIERMAESNCGGTIGREEGVRSRGSSSGVQGNETTRCESVFDGFDCCDLEWKLHESTFGNSLVEQSSDEQRFASRAAAISGHLHNDHGIGVARLDEKAGQLGKLVWRLDDFVLAGICYADDVVMVAASVAAAEVMVAEVIAKLKDVGLTVGPEDGRQKHHGGRIGCVVGGSPEACGIEGVSGRECKTCDRAQISSSQHMSGEMELVLNSSWPPRLMRRNIVKTTMWQAFLWSSSVWTTRKAQRDKISSWSARVGANVIGVKKPP